MDSPVEHWFGKGFEELDPLIQNLHRVGGRLQGKVDLQYGSGLAGLIGRRIGAKIGLPSLGGTKELEVEINNHIRLQLMPPVLAMTMALAGSI